MFISTEERAHESDGSLQESLVDLFVRANVGLAALDNRYRYLCRNQVYQALLGPRTCTEAAGTHAEPELTEALRPLADEERVLDQVVVPDGSTEKVLVSATMVRLGDAEAFIAVARPYRRLDLLPGSGEDMRDDPISDWALDDLDRFFDLLPAAVHQVSDDVSFLRANRFQLSLLGYADRPDQFVGQNLVPFFARPEDFDEMGEHMGSPYGLRAYPSPMVHADGREIPLSIYSTHIETSKVKATSRCFLFA